MFDLSFRGKPQDFRARFAEFSKSLTLIADLEQLKDNVIATIRQVTRVDSVAIFLHNPDMNRMELAEARGCSTSAGRRAFFAPDGPLMQWFTVNATFLQVSHQREVMAFLSASERGLIETLDIDLIFPLLVMNHVTGLVCLGVKTDHAPFTPHEIDLLNSFLGQAAFAFENAYLYEQQKNRLKKMYRADRLANLGQLAAGAAHEIRNPLTSIRSTIQYLERDFDDPVKRDMVTTLISEVDRINTIIEGLLSFSKPSPPQMEEVDLALLIDQTVQLIGATAEKRCITLESRFLATHRTLTADPAQLRQVLLNIMMNGIQSMDKGGILRVTVDISEHMGHPSDGSTSFLITIEDTGTGIPEEHQDHIFDPFFTTKKDGTGLGLSISYGIIRQHGGDIEIKSRTTGDAAIRGTTVSITLPLSQGGESGGHR